MESGKVPAIFLDRDGVVNRRRVGDYVKSIDEFEFYPEVFEVLPAMVDAGFRIILVTNQRGISRRIMTEHDLATIHHWMQDRLEQEAGVSFKAIYHCPHGTDDNCECRKPKPGMVLRGIRELDVEVEQSWMIGDSISDIIAGRLAGCRTALVVRDKNEAIPLDVEVEIRSTTLRGVWDQIVSWMRIESV